MTVDLAGKIGKTYWLMPAVQEMYCGDFAWGKVDFNLLLLVC